jgi:transposase
LLRQEEAIFFFGETYPLQRLAEVLSGEYAGSMKAYSTDLRERVIGAAKQGMLQREIANVFAISLSTIKRYLKQWRDTATLQSKPIPGRPAKKLKPVQASVSQLLASAPDATLEQLCQACEDLSGIRVSISTMSRAIQRQGWTRKKRHWVPPSAMRRHAVFGENR